MWNYLKATQKSNILQRYIFPKTKAASIVRALYNGQKKEVSKIIIVNSIPLDEQDKSEEQKQKAVHSKAQSGEAKLGFFQSQTKNLKKRGQTNSETVFNSSKAWQSHSNKSEEELRMQYCITSQYANEYATYQMTKSKQIDFQVHNIVDILQKYLLCGF